ncbi:DUF6492 family protein [Paenibacillus pinihumi]|uniref:DUF6492 family protein n=1 Tax=Paenibacillus pinihumi TaxID=669462 RepID=UPI00042261D2|nr:DUF6492 family protein [Paenibacillus pinihumi]
MSKSPGSRIVIDVFIPAIEKDLGTLPYVIDSVRKHVKHPIDRIMIVSPDRPAIRKAIAKKGCTFVNERNVLPFTKQDINYRSKRWERSGWLYQQLLKLGGERFGNQRHYLVIDADTILLRPHRFKSGEKFIFYSRKWSQDEYFNTYSRLLGKKASAPRSFVAHYMLFDKKKVRELKQTIEKRHGVKWYSAILRSINKKKQFGFSEFETYGNFLYARNASRVSFKRALNKSLGQSYSALAPARKKSLAKAFRSLSFHKRKGYVRNSKG